MSEQDTRLSTFAYTTGYAVALQDVVDFLTLQLNPKARYSPTKLAEIIKTLEPNKNRIN